MVSKQANRLLVSGGRQRKKALDLDEWHAYEAAILVEVDLDTGSCRTVVEYVSPSECCPDEAPSIVFKAGDYDSTLKRFLVTTQTEILEYDVGDWRLVRRLTHPWFNDLHHVCRGTAGDLVVANTGLDQILRVRAVDESNDTEIIDVRSTVTHAESFRDPWYRFEANTDYRKVATTKPHVCHPNYVFQYGGRWFATRFHQQDAIELENPACTIPISPGNPHDGIVRGESVVFTTTNGHLVEYDFESSSVQRIIDLNRLHPNGTLLGWCRGVCMLEDHQAWVGFSRIRPTWLRKNLSWIKQGFRLKGEYGTEPTRIVNYDFREEKALREIDLEPYGLNAVFGIHAFESPVADPKTTEAQ